MTRASSQVVLLDIDEVLFPFAQAYDRWLFTARGIGLDREHLSRYDIPTAAGAQHDELVVRFLSDPKTIAEEGLIPQAAEALPILSARSRLIACTSRHSHDEGEATRAWLQAHTPCIEDVIFTRHKRTDPGTAKAQIARETAAVMLIDDTFQHLIGLPASCQGILMRRPRGLPSAANAVSWASVLHASG